jgi:hypothetical protein
MLSSFTISQETSGVNSPSTPSLHQVEPSPPGALEIDRQPSSPLSEVPDSPSSQLEILPVRERATKVDAGKGANVSIFYGGNKSVATGRQETASSVLDLDGDVEMDDKPSQVSKDAAVLSRPTYVRNPSDIQLTD